MLQDALGRANRFSGVVAGDHEIVDDVYVRTWFGERGRAARAHALADALEAFDAAVDAGAAPARAATTPALATAVAAVQASRLRLTARAAGDRVVEHPEPGEPARARARGRGLRGRLPRTPVARARSRPHARRLRAARGRSPGAARAAAPHAADGRGRRARRSGPARRAVRAARQGHPRGAHEPAGHGVLRRLRGAELDRDRAPGEPRDDALARQGSSEVAVHDERARLPDRRARRARARARAAAADRDRRDAARRGRGRLPARDGLRPQLAEDPVPLRRPRRGDGLGADRLERSRAPAPRRRG